MAKQKVTGVEDPENYRTMSTPFSSLEDAQDELDQFFEEVRIARQKHKIADVHVIVSTNVKTENLIKRFSGAAHFGDATNGLEMSAEGMKVELDARKKVIAAARNRKRG
jgi:hypothetical protein